MSGGNPRSKDCCRNNLSSSASIYRYSIFAVGTFKNVYKGEYTNGSRKGQRCVGKTFKDRAVFEQSFFNHELDVVAKAMEIITRYNDQGFLRQTIYLNQPQIWEYQNNQEKTMVEPMIANFEKFNSNNGWVNQESGWPDVMQALSHFSYHSTGGAFVLCDLQGGVRRDGVVLTDPVVVSRDKRFGPTDLGAEGISNFFAHHQCNEYCNGSWTSPKHTRVLPRAQP